MRITLALLISLISIQVIAQPRVRQVGALPEKISNNAVTEGYIFDMPFLFSFGGIDSTLDFSGIHRRSYRFNTLTGEVIRIPDLPDTLGKIASAASFVDERIYIIGGYHVYQDGSEKTTNTVHRYDLENNIFLSDGTPIPVPVDDQVQAVWRDSLIYVITGWSDEENVNTVQIYNPKYDQWTTGTALPNLPVAKSFGSSGTIVGDTIYFFGGAASTPGFPIQSNLRIGIINPVKPNEIDWQITRPDEDIVGYRMASTHSKGIPRWLGGSTKTYNYDGIAYDGSGIVSPSEHELSLNKESNTWNVNDLPAFPMDLRGIGKINDTVQFIVGGMLKNQELSNKILMLNWTVLGTGTEEIKQGKRYFYLYPNPCSHQLRILNVERNRAAKRIELFTMQGIKILDRKLTGSNDRIPMNNLPDRAYIIRITDQKGNFFVDKVLTK